LLRSYLLEGALVTVVGGNMLDGLGLRHGAYYPDEELWTITTRWCGRLGVLVDWRIDHITKVCFVEDFQPYVWNSIDLCTSCASRTLTYICMLQ
jgi:hypothetical protein